jgi:hypothetical protein
MESPESWFEDFGEARLVDGKARVHIDPDFAAVISGEYHVFVAPYGDSNGLYVHRRDHASFEVHEHKGGTSTFTFSYRIIARRKDIEGRRLEKVTLPSFDRPKMPTPVPTDYAIRT